MADDALFSGKVIVITGASAGLGRAIAREFAKYGATLALLARGEDGLNAAVQEVHELGGTAKAYITDVGNNEEIEAAAGKIEKELGPIDIWINNAMNSVFGPVKQLKPKDFKRVTDVTYLGQVYGAMAALKYMLPRDKGSIIFVGSALAYRGIPLQSAYCGAKHGIHGFFESLRAELIHDKSNIHASMVQLPAMNTTQFGFVKSYLPNKPKPMGAIYEPEIAARAIVYTALHHPRELYVGGSTVKTIIGNKLIPGYLDNYLAKTGYDGQQTSEPAEKNKPNNLYHPIPGDHGAHGNFDSEAKKYSAQVYMTTHKRLIAVAASLLLVSIGLFSWTKNS